MAQHRHYSGDPRDWEAKLDRVMTRMKATSYSWNYDRVSAWIRFERNGEPYAFHQSIDRAGARKVALYNGVDCLAQLVLTLEDLCRMGERGIYDLGTFLVGFKALPPPRAIPEPFRRLGFAEEPTSVEQVRARYKALTKIHHPDVVGGDAAEFIALRAAYAAALALMNGGSADDDDAD